MQPVLLHVAHGPEQVIRCAKGQGHTRRFASEKWKCSRDSRHPLLPYSRPARRGKALPGGGRAVSYACALEDAECHDGGQFGGPFRTLTSLASPREGWTREPRHRASTLPRGLTCRCARMRGKSAKAPDPKSFRSTLLDSWLSPPRYTTKAHSAHSPPRVTNLDGVLSSGLRLGFK